MLRIHQTGTVKHRGRRCWPVICAGLLVLSGCGVRPDSGVADAGSTDDGTVLVSIINVTSYEVTALLSGILDDAVDTVLETIGPIDSVDIPFVCIDELVVGDPLETAAAGVTINRDGEIVELTPFSVSGRDFFRCGDVLEIIISGDDPDSFAVDVFVFTPP